MNWFLNLKTRNKLLLSFLVMAGITAIVGAFGIQASGRIQAGLVSVNQNNFVPLTHLAAARENILKIRINVLKHILTSDQAKMAAIDSDILNLASGVDSQLSLYEQARLTSGELTALGT